MTLSDPVVPGTRGIDATSVVVVEADPGLGRYLSDVLAAHRPTVIEHVTLLDGRLAPGAAVVMVLGPSCADPIALAAVERLSAQLPASAAVLVLDAVTTDTLQRALRAGVRDVLPLPLDQGQLQVAVERLVAVVTPLVPARAPAPVAGPADQSGLEPGGGPGRLITVFSTKGGAGKSVVASNLGVAMARRSERPVVLVDADLQFGDIAVMLKMAPQHTIVDAVNAIDRLDAAMLQSLLVRHEPSGLLVLAAPLEPAFADQVGSAEMGRIIETLRSFASAVVVDTPAYFNDVVLSLIESSDDVLLVAGMDIPNIKNVKIGLQTLRLLNIPVEKLKLVLNRANSKVKLDVAEVERTLGIKADCLVPSDIVVPQAVNKGVAVVLEAPKSGVARSIEALADMFVAAPQQGRRRR